MSQRKSKLFALRRLKHQEESPASRETGKAIIKKHGAVKSKMKQNSKQRQPAGVIAYNKFHKAKTQHLSSQSGCSLSSLSDNTSEDSKRLTEFPEEPEILDLYQGKTTRKLTQKPRSPRRVAIHPSEFPSKDWFSKKFTHSDTDDEDQLSEWQEGNMLWAKVRGYPFWPCMVSKDPFSKLFTRAVGTNKASRSYHVQFFGSSGERSWINEASLLQYEGREKFLDIVQYGLENPTPGCKSPSQFKISTAWYPAWSLAVAEAEGAYKLSLEDRKSQYTFQYVFVKGDEEKPVNKLLEMIWKRATGQQERNKMGLDDAEHDNDVDDIDSIYFDIFKEKRERPWYDSDDFYSSDDSLSNDGKQNRQPIKIAVREGLFDVFCAKHARFVGQDHADWDDARITEHLRQQWCMMSYLQRSRYTSRYQKPVFVEVKQCKKQSYEIIEEDVDPSKLDLCIIKLTTGCLETKQGHVCSTCELGGTDLQRCGGICACYFHVNCVGDGADEGFKCSECSTGLHKCFACKKEDRNLKPCSYQQCGRQYHEECVGEIRNAISDRNGLICPLHTCATCIVEENAYAREGPFVECVHCPTAYHQSDLCIAAGSQILGQQQLLCPQHFRAAKHNSLHSKVSVKRCLDCGNGGHLLQCENCPAAYHEGCGSGSSHTSMIKRVKGNSACLTSGVTKKKGKQPEMWQCTCCGSGRRPLYGDIVWVKLGFYRWWPAEVCHPIHVPKELRNKSHQVGEFPVRFFGSHDFSWIHQGRVYPFDKGDGGSKTTCANTLDETFYQGVREAAAAHTLSTSVRRVKKEEQNEQLRKQNTGLSQTLRATKL